MKNTVRKILCIMMVIVHVLSANNPVMASALRVGATASTAADLYYELEVVEDGAVWACPDEEEYYQTHGRMRDLSDYLNHAEYESFRASGMRLTEFMDMRETGLWFCVNLNMWVDPEEHGIVFLWELPLVDIDEWLENEIAIAQQDTFLPSSSLPFTPPGVTTENTNNMWYAYEQGMYYCPAKGLYYDPAQDKWFDAARETWHNLQDLTFLQDMPFSDEPWLEYGETQEIIGVTIWACPDEEAYYLTHGRYRNILDYMSLAEYEIFSASGMRLAEFNAIRESGMSLTAMTALFAPELALEARYGYPGHPGYCEYNGEIICFYSLPIIEESEWLEYGQTPDIWGETIWACPDEEMYYLMYGRYLDHLLYMTLAEYEVFRASGMRFIEFLNCCQSPT